MKAEILSTTHTIGIDKAQLDIFYFFRSHTMEVYVDGELMIHAQFNPSRMILSYTNVVDIAVFYYETYCKREQKKAKDEANEFQD